MLWIKSTTLHFLFVKRYSIVSKREWVNMDTTYIIEVANNNQKQNANLC